MHQPDRTCDLCADHPDTRRRMSALFDAFSERGWRDRGSTALNIARASHHGRTAVRMAIDGRFRAQNGVNREAVFAVAAPIVFDEG